MQEAKLIREHRSSIRALFAPTSLPLLALAAASCTSPTLSPEDVGATRAALGSEIEIYAEEGEEDGSGRIVARVLLPVGPATGLTEQTVDPSDVGLCGIRRLRGYFDPLSQAMIDVDLDSGYYVGVVSMGVASYEAGNTPPSMTVSCIRLSQFEGVDEQFLENLGNGSVHTYLHETEHAGELDEDDVMCDSLAWSAEALPHWMYGVDETPPHCTFGGFQGALQDGRDERTCDGANGPILRTDVGAWQDFGVDADRGGLSYSRELVAANDYSPDHRLSASTTDQKFEPGFMRSA